MNISFVHRYRYFIYRCGCDMRKGNDGLCGLVINEFKMSPLSGDVIVFISKPCNKIKYCTGKSKHRNLHRRKINYTISTSDSSWQKQIASFWRYKCLNFDWADCGISQDNGVVEQWIHYFYYIDFNFILKHRLLCMFEKKCLNFDWADCGISQE